MVNEGRLSPNYHKPADVVATVSPDYLHQFARLATGFLVETTHVEAIVPTASPTVTPTAQPTAQPSAQPTAQSGPLPTLAPSPSPSSSGGAFFISGSITFEGVTTSQMMTRTMQEAAPYASTLTYHLRVAISFQCSKGIRFCNQAVHREAASDRVGSRVLAL